MKNINICWLIIFPFILGGCFFKVQSSNRPKAPEVPTNTNTNVVPPQNNENTEPQTQPEDDQPTIDLTKNYISVEEIDTSYYVGETFSKAFRANITLVKDGVEKDVTYRSSAYNIILKKADGTVADAGKPFQEAGDYQYKLVSKVNSQIVSPLNTIHVSNSPGELTTKTILPSNFTYYDLENSCLDNLSIPSKGNLNVLVIPVEISDYPFISSNLGAGYLNSINKAFNGSGVNDTNYWESVSSYYSKSSFGQLNLSFTIADVYKSSYSTESLISYGVSGAFVMAELAFNDFKGKHTSSYLRDFDNDNDGYVDGVWFIYSAPNYSTGTYGSTSGQDLFWAFCSDYEFGSANLSNPALHSFGWASIDFMYEFIEGNGLDTHVFIHETGHLLSLPDYYNYDLTTGQTSGAQGGLAMMDLNIADHDSFSKLALGWSNPYVPTSDCVIELKPNTTTGDCILLADHWNGTAFDEYILLDLVTPTGLNALDSQTSYNNRPKFFDVAGIRAYHIDARLGEFKYYSNSEKPSGQGVYPVMENGKNYYLDDDFVKEVVSDGLAPMSTDFNFIPSERQSGYTVINANSPSRVKIDENQYKNNRLITLMGSNNVLCEHSEVYASNSFLFLEGDTWTMRSDTIKYFMGDAGKFNNNDDFSFVFSVLSCNTVSAKIQIRKLNNNG